MHRQVAEDHGFTAIADFDLMYEEGDIEWPVSGGRRLDRIIVGSHAENYTDWVILSHFKGHAMAGFGGAVKNVGIGISSARGKVLVHSAGARTSGSIMHSDQEEWLEALSEMVKGFRDHVGEEHIIYINVMNRLSVDCDCGGPSRGAGHPRYRHSGLFRFRSTGPGLCGSDLSGGRKCFSGQQDRKPGRTPYPGARRGDRTGKQDL
jgi:uncharacterized Fe-S center protein